MNQLLKTPSAAAHQTPNPGVEFTLWTWVGADLAQHRPEPTWRWAPMDTCALAGRAAIELVPLALQTVE